MTASEVAAAFEKAGIVSVPRPDIMRWKYRKLMMNLGNAVQALCAADDDRNELVATIRAEGEAVLTAAGIDPISEADDRERRGDILQIGDVPGRPARAAPPGRAWSVGPARSRPTTSTARSSGSAGSMPSTPPRTS